MSRIFFFSLSLSHWTLSASSKMLHRWRIVSKSGKKKGGRCAHRERGGDSGMGHHSWFLCLAFQMKTGPGLTGTRLSKKFGSEILDIRLWQVLYQHTQSALINPHTWERHKTWLGLSIPKVGPLGSRTKPLRIAQTQLLPLSVSSSSLLLWLSNSVLNTS